MRTISHRLSHFASFRQRLDVEPKKPRHLRWFRWIPSVMSKMVSNGAA